MTTTISSISKYIVNNCKYISYIVAFYSRDLDLDFRDFRLPDFGLPDFRLPTSDLDFPDFHFRLPLRTSFSFDTPVIFQRKKNCIVFGPFQGTNKMIK